jgi:hypothetical protein
MPGSVIVGGARTPIGKLSGALKGFKAVELAAVRGGVPMGVPALTITPNPDKSQARSTPSTAACTCETRRDDPRP